MKLGKLAKQILGKAAPMLGAAFGGPLGGMAGKFLADQLGVDVKDLDKEITQADPKTFAEIQKAEQAFDVEMKKLGLEEEHLHADDRADARLLGREKGTRFQMSLSAVFLLGYFSLMYMLFTSDVTAALDDWAKGQLGILIGVLTAAVAQIMAYWFGSSSGSKEKTALLNGSAS